MQHYDCVRPFLIFGLTSDAIPLGSSPAETFTLSQVSAEPSVCMPCSPTPEVLLPDLFSKSSVAFRYVQDVGSSMFRISGLNHTAYPLAVYASPFGCPYSARLASSCWSGLSGRVYKFLCLTAAYITLRLLSAEPAGFF
jgi:hypothetical protein